MIPVEKQALVKKALRTAFNVDDFDHIEQLTKGLSSALIFKITIKEKPYLLRVVMRTDAIGDPSYYYGCMKLAAEKNLAPAIHYMSIEDRISVTDFIIEKPFSIEEAKVQLPKLLQTLHSLPNFPFRMNYFEAMERFIPMFNAGKFLPENETGELFEIYRRIISKYPINDVENWVSCHNDSKPENIIFDGQKPWFVDWEAAFLNDRYLDLAVVANFIVMNEKDEEDYLKTYFNQPADDYQRARFFIMQIILHLNYFVVLLAFTKDPQPLSITPMPTHNFREFHNGMWNGAISLANNESKREYALLHLEHFRSKTRSPGFEEALKIISKRK